MSKNAETVEFPALDPGVEYYTRIATSKDFVALRRRFLGFVVPMTVAYMLWYALFVLLAMYAPDFMAIKVAGDLTVGLVMGGLQFLSTFVLAARYVRFANNMLDPAAAAIRNAVGTEQHDGSRPGVGPHPTRVSGPPLPERTGTHRMWDPRDGVASPARDRISGGIA